MCIVVSLSYDSVEQYFLSSFLSLSDFVNMMIFISMTL